MYQPYPAGGQTPAPPQPPQPVLTAVRLMYVGAGLEVLGLLLNLVTISKAGSSNVADGIFGPAVGAALWLWMAAANKAGKSWARVTSTVFFGIDCLFLLLILLGAGALMSLVGGAAAALVAIVIVASVVIWLVGLCAIVLLWRGESSAYFTAMSAPR